MYSDVGTTLCMNLGSCHIMADIIILESATVFIFIIIFTPVWNHKKRSISISFFLSLSLSLSSFSLSYFFQFHLIISFTLCLYFDSHSICFLRHEVGFEPATPRLQGPSLFYVFLTLSLSMFVLLPISKIAIFPFSRFLSIYVFMAIAYLPIAIPILCQFLQSCELKFYTIF